MKARYLLLAVAVLSCRDASAPPPGPQTNLFSDPLPLLDPLPKLVGLLTCTPLPYDSVTQTIGPEGGTIQVGVHTLWVPPGALGAPVAITAVAPSDTVNRVRFQPEGLTFGQPAALVTGYGNCDLLGSTLPKRIAYTTDALLILDYLPSLDDLGSQTVRGWLRHFSDYAIAW
jgi:hypothetical protein